MFCLFQKFRQAYDRQVKRGEPCEKAAFDYAHALIRGTRPQVLMGIQLLEGILCTLTLGSGLVRHWENVGIFFLYQTELDACLMLGKIRMFPNIGPNQIGE